MAGDRRLVIEAIATHHVDRALEHEPDRDMALADVEDDLTRREFPQWPLAKRLAVSIWTASSTGNSW